MPVNSHHDQYTKAAPKWKRCRDASAGQDAVHEAGADYLPRLGGQNDEEYSAYNKRAMYYNATGRTIDGLSGMLFRKPLQVELPPAIDRLKDDITREGTSLQNFAEMAAEESLQVGRFGILVDHPPGLAVVTEAQAQAQRLRPYMRLYMTESILNWKVEDGILVMVVLEECIDEAEDEFTSKDKKQWRVLDLTAEGYRQRIFQKKEADGKDEIVQIGDDIFPVMGGQYMSYIPFIFSGVRDMSPGVDLPPLLDLVDVNLSHYRSTADYEHGLHWCGCPTAVVTGHTLDPGKNLVIGSANAWIFPDPNAKASLLELKADSLGALEKALERKEGQMAALGARMLAPDKKMAEAAETAAIHRGGEISVLASQAQAISGALEAALTIMAEWAGAAGEIICQLNRDYLPTTMSAQDIVARLQSWQGGAISHETFYDMLVEGEVITKPTNFDDEKEKIDENPPGMMTGSASGA